MKKNRKVERIRILNINQDVAISRHSWVIGFHESIELVDTLQSMFIRCVAMKKFVLYKAFKCADLREISAKNSAPMH